MRLQLSILTLVAASQLGATDCGQVLRDPGFDLWCGDDLCSWKVVRGDAKRVATWHDGDSGVELVGSDAAISQLSPVTYSDGTCIRFDLVANVSEDAEARLGLDIYGDGSIELSERMPTSNWKPLSYKVRIAKPYTGIRFELSKRGPGTAQFAQIGAAIDDGCDGLTEITANPAPLGAYCLEDGDCASGLCKLVPEPSALFGVANRCVGCDPALGALACAAGEVCSRGEPLSPVRGVPIACEPAPADALGEQCASDGECASGLCTSGACSACRTTADCGGGVACGPAWPNGPFVCAPGAGARVTGEACGTDADCASAHCNGGARSACADNRPCFHDTNCPVDDGLVPGACTTVGVQGGSCE